MTSALPYTPQRLKKWTLPESYMGAAWDGYYVFLGQNRDSDSVSRSNFICALEALGGETGFDEGDVAGVAVIREGHWACGWIEWIAIHETNEKALRAADKIMRDLEAYPVVSEDHLSQLEFDEACEYWERCSLRERIALAADNGLSIFVARRDELPEDHTGSLMEALR